MKKPKKTSKKVVKAWIVLRGDNQIASLNSEWDYSMSLFDDKESAKERMAVMVDLNAKVVPCAVSFSLPKRNK